nr:dicarboxylate/amino acid:cation symporter [Lachnospiraceae bacterium]
YQTLFALALGLAFGFLMKLVIPHHISDGIKDYALSPFKTVFMNSLKIIIAPVIFFSLACCISQFKNLSDLGRIGSKVMGTYLLTTLLAVCVGLFYNHMVRPGKVGFALNSANSLSAPTVDVSTDASHSFLDTIIGIVPSNFLQPFLESNTLQLLFLAIICGIAVKTIGEYSKILTDFFEACNSLFLTITSAIAKFIPFAVFCSISMLIYDLGGSTIKHLGSYLCTVIVALLTMIPVYSLLVLLLTRTNPVTFFKNIKEGMLTSFSLSSSNAAMPTNMKVCTEKLGISPKVVNFSIPLGATINMDGFTVCLSITVLFFARGYNIPITGSALVSILLTIILLSMATPGVPGSSIVSICVLLKVANIPLEAASLFIAVYPMIDMVGTMTNTTGDMAATFIAAKSEKLVDMEVFKG